jgi:hypothetical protein
LWDATPHESLSRARLWRAATQEDVMPLVYCSDPDDATPNEPIVEPADPEDDPAYDEVEIVDEDEFGEPEADAPADDDDEEDDWDKSEI